MAIARRYGLQASESSGRSATYADILNIKTSRINQTGRRTASPVNCSDSAAGHTACRVTTVLRIARGEGLHGSARNGRCGLQGSEPSGRSATYADILKVKASRINQGDFRETETSPRHGDECKGLRVFRIP